MVRDRQWDFGAGLRAADRGFSRLTAPTVDELDDSAEPEGPPWLTPRSRLDPDALGGAQELGLA
jgi:hypothetical protein